jgi:hypothetical protein
MRTKIEIAIIFLIFIGHLKSYSQKEGLISDYLEVLNKKSQEPVDFINNKLNEYDLIIFDDALHSAKEPFDFYQKLIKDSLFIKKCKYIFVEAFSIASQPLVYEYLNNSVRDSTILLPVFQDDFTGMGFRYKTYLDLLSTIWQENKKLSLTEKIKVICVDQPIYWEGIHTREDYDIFQKSLTGRDYFMYKVISQTLDNFKSGEKGVFFTNTRHAYKRLKRVNNELYWNTGTFLNQWHPGKSYSVRIHNVNLFIRARLEKKSQSSTEGLDEVSYNWVRMENGLWDKSFKEMGNIPLAFSLKNNIFGKSAYAGNLMLNVADNQTMYDVYDGIIFLAPLEELHFSAKTDFIYTNSFKKELKRRIQLLKGERLDSFLYEEGVATIDDYIEKLVKFQDSIKNPLVPSKKI